MTTELDILYEEYKAGLPFWGSDNPEEKVIKHFRIDNETEVRLTLPVFVWQMIKHLRALTDHHVKWRSMHDYCLANVDTTFNYDALFAHDIIQHFCILYPEHSPDDFYGQNS